METMIDLIMYFFSICGMTFWTIIFLKWLDIQKKRRAERRLADYVNNYSRNNGARKAYQAYTKPK